MNVITFKIINYDTSEYRAAMALREEILRKPLGLTFSPEELETRKDHIHIAGFEGSEIIATAVLVPEGDTCKMQRVVVKSDMQDSEVGSQMMAFCELQAKARSFTSIYCHARDTAVQFYLKNQYSPEGDYFDEDTIPHLKMRKLLIGHITAATKEEAEIIHKRIDDFNKRQLSFTGNMESAKNYVIKDGSTIIAGITSCFYLEEILYVSVLFVDKDYRRKGLGSTLLKQVETEAKAMGGMLAHLDTFDFQSKDFYLKHGYEIFGMLEDCPKGHKRYYLKKSL